MKLIIYGEPMGKQRPRHGKGYTYTPQKTVNYETLVQEMWILSNHEMLQGQVRIEVNAYLSIPKSVSRVKREMMLSGRTRPVKKPDWDNLGKIISDALNKLAYHDDSQIVSAHVEKWYSDKPRVEVEIEEVE